MIGSNKPHGLLRAGSGPAPPLADTGDLDRALKDYELALQLAPAGSTWRKELLDRISSVEEKKSTATRPVVSEPDSTTEKVNKPVAADGLPIFFISGDIEEGDERDFIDQIVGVPHGLVIFDSDGGNLNAGLAIGRAIRLKGFATLVPDGNRCASACALAWLGGQKRYTGTTLPGNVALNPGQA